jgi:pSer/pThr/pTyr-binding forkhead associated (FHA) protein
VQNGGVILVDLGSTYGTLVNGLAVTRVRLNVGDKINCGKSTILTIVHKSTVVEKSNCVVC